MKRFCVGVLVGLWAVLVAQADGFIIVPGPFPGPLPRPRPLPRPFPPPWPRPLPRPPVYRFAPLEVVFHHVTVRIHDQIATTAVDQEFYNPNDRQLEGTYIFPVPKGAQIDHFSMEINGKRVEAELLSANKARRIYEDIVRRYRDPALLEYVGRDLFKVRIFPIEPHSKKRIKLSYTQLLPADAGLVNYVYPLNTERFSAAPIRNVSLKINLDTTRPLKSIYSPSHKVEIRRHGDHTATVGFEAKDVRPDTDFQLFYATEPGEIGVNLLTYKDRYDDGYFLLLAAPAYTAKSKHVLLKDVAFVLDTSGSMAGKKIEQAKKALLFCVDNLNAGDRFDVIRFSTDTEPLFGKLVKADPAHRERATAFVRKLQAIGGTDIYGALKQALRSRPADSERPYYVIFLTDGLPTVGEVDSDAIVRMVRDNDHGTRVFCFGLGHDVNTHLLDRITETTHAASAYVSPEEDLEVKLSNFFTKIKEPVLAQVHLDFPGTIHVSKLYPSPLPDLFKGEQLVLVGRYAGHGSGKLELKGTVNGMVTQFRYPVEFPAADTTHEFIPRLWATRRIGYLLDQIRLHGENAELRGEVVRLAKKYSIVTPYTAYLIHEDEVRRGVPLAQQTLPQLGTDQAALNLSRQAYRALTSADTGAAAVAAARYGLSQKSANQVGTALAAGRVEAQRALMASAPASMATPMAGPTGSAIGGARVGMRFGSSSPAPTGRIQKMPVAASAAPVANAAQAARQAVAYSEETRFVGGRSFFANGHTWIDTEVQQHPKATRKRITFGSPEYFALLEKHPQVRLWLALGQNVQFVLGNTIYEVHE